MEERSRWFKAIGSGLLAMMISLVMTACSGVDGIVLDLGPASTLGLEETWQELAEAGDFESSTARLESLDLAYAPSGALVHLSLLAVTSDSRLLQVGWGGLGGLDDQNVHLSGVISTPGVMVRTTPAMETILVAIDEVGAKSMIAKMPASPPGTYFTLASMQDQNSYGPGIAASATAYIWEDGQFVRMGNDDERRLFSPADVFLVMYAMVPVSSSSTPVNESNSTSTSMYQSESAVYYVIPGTP